MLLQVIQFNDISDFYQVNHMYAEEDYFELDCADGITHTIGLLQKSDECVPWALDEEETFKIAILMTEQKIEIRRWENEETAEPENEAVAVKGV
jgi:hypothetical protein